MGEDNEPNMSLLEMENVRRARENAETVSLDLPVTEDLGGLYEPKHRRERDHTAAGRARLRIAQEVRTYGAQRADERGLVYANADMTTGKIFTILREEGLIE